MASEHVAWYVLIVCSVHKTTAAGAEKRQVLHKACKTVGVLCIAGIVSVPDVYAVLKVDYNEVSSNGSSSDSDSSPDLEYEDEGSPRANSPDPELSTGPADIAEKGRCGSQCSYVLSPAHSPACLRLGCRDSAVKAKHYRSDVPVCMPVQPPAARLQQGWPTACARMV